MAFLIATFVPAFKIGSGECNNYPLIEHICKFKKPIILSTGMSSVEEIQITTSLLNSRHAEFVLLHCNSTYPMKEEDANLLCISMLRDRYNCDVGYSGHESSLIKISIAAVTLGATSIERHITLDRAMYGSDQSASIEIDALAQYVKAVRNVPLILGSGKKIISKSEDEVRQKLRIEIDD